ncbi:hypothetical protein YC2023_081926 [Brassica napus]
MDEKRMVGLLSEILIKSRFLMHTQGITFRLNMRASFQSAAGMCKHPGPDEVPPRLITSCHHSALTRS